MSKYKHNKIFTKEEANQALVLVKPIVSDILTIVKSISQIELIPFSEIDKILEVKSEIQSKQHLLVHHINELHNLGVITRDIFYGIVDFPTLDNGKLQYYCWQFNEPEICFYHGKNCSFSKRKYLYNIINTKYGTQD